MESGLFFFTANNTMLFKPWQGYQGKCDRFKWNVTANTNGRIEAAK